MPARGMSARGVTIVELAALVLILVLAGAVYLAVQPTICYESPKVECLNNIRNLVGLLEMIADRADYPSRSGADLLLDLVTRGDLEGPDSLTILFCPADRNESFPGVAAYRDLDLSRPAARGDLTSYAGRDLRDARCIARHDAQPPAVLLCDDSEDHHEGGFVVGLTGGSVRWRDKIENWGLDPKTRVVVGEGSVIEELQCLRVD